MKIHLYSIDDFLNFAKKRYHLSMSQMAGFRAIMLSKHLQYVSDPKRYIKPLRYYLRH